MSACFSCSVFSAEDGSFRLSEADSVAFYGCLQAGVDMYNKRDYAGAIHYLEKAYGIDRWNIVLQETLYFSYIYMNRDFEARQLYYILPSASREAYRLQPPKVVTSAYLEGGVMGSMESAPSLPEKTYYEERAVPHLGQNYTVKLNHDAGGAMRMSHGFSYSYSESGQRIDSMMSTIFSGDVSTAQLSYTLSAPIYLERGWRFTPSVYISHVRSRYYQVRFDTTATDNPYVNPYLNPYVNPYVNPNNPKKAPSDASSRSGLRQGWGGGGYFYPYRSNYGYGWYGYSWPVWGWNIPWLGGESYAYTFEDVEETFCNYALDLDLSKTYRHSEFSAALTYLRTGEKSVWKCSFQWLCFLRGNLDAYTLLRPSYILREDADASFLAEGLLGFKAAGWLWVELGGLWGNMNSHSDRHLGVVYAMVPRSSYRLVSNLIFPLSDRLSASLLYRLTKSEATVYYAPTESELAEQSYAIYGNNCFMGLKWTF